MWDHEVYVDYVNALFKELEAEEEVKLIHGCMTFTWVETKLPENCSTMAHCLATYVDSTKKDTLQLIFESAMGCLQKHGDLCLFDKSDVNQSLEMCRSRGFGEDWCKLETEG